MENITIKINGIEVSAPKGSTILEAARLAHIEIPTLCFLKDINEIGACRICVVEQVSPPAKNLQASCMVEAKDGMVIETNNARVQEARKTMYELLLSNHDKKCLTCARNQDCEFQALGRELGVEDSPYEGERDLKPIDVSESITRDPNKCILCRRCVSVCKNIQTTSILTAENRGFQTVITPAFGLPMGNTACTFCGQCVIVCPVGALRETTHKDRVIQAINDPNKHVVVQPAPAVRVGIGECFGLPAGTCETGKLAAALHRMGFDDVFDTNWGADLTIMEEGTEFLERFRAVISGGVATLPMITSCSPGWVTYLEKHHPELIDHLSTAKSPQQMFGAVAKSYYAEKLGKAPEDIFCVSVMPCTAKKYESATPEVSDAASQDVDVVLTTRELDRMLRAMQINVAALPEEDFDSPLGRGSGAGVIFGVTGGVMEAALRTAYWQLTGNNPPADAFQEIRGQKPWREASFTIGEITVRLAVASGLGSARQLMDALRSGQVHYDFVEVMACPGGCSGGGGQPIHDGQDFAAQRGQQLYQLDAESPIRFSHENPDVQALYREYLGQPLSEKAHHLLHTDQRTWTL